ncbi:hypothetical protein ACFY78_41865 [Streptomyces olindensis]|uniref:hypothetical protein n=1 Tax=Streptomyces olindensis TaxID=358823 RepID=UPI00367D6ADF
MTTLTLAAHPCTPAPRRADMDDLARLCGHSRHQTAELLDRLVATHTLAAWHHDRDADEVLWQLPPHDAWSHRRPTPGCTT